MTATIYEKIGGAAAVQATVEGLYTRVLADPALRPFFSHTFMAHQKQEMYRFIAEALGGPKSFIGRSMLEVHKNVEIESFHFEKVVFHLAATLKALDVPSDLSSAWFDFRSGFIVDVDE
jgi:hemoglobin